MASEISKTQIDRLGDRLKKGNITEADLRLLDLYRRSFAEAYDVVVSSIRNDLGLEPTGRYAKTNESISNKLRRESIRLTQIQDIAGCRLIVQNIAVQDKVVQSLNNLFERTIVVDRRQQPSHGYRAVHVIVTYRGKLIEIQIRTQLQQLWAELSEKYSDVDPAIKYGGGDEIIRRELAETSSLVAGQELDEIEFAGKQFVGLMDDDMPDQISIKEIFLREQLLKQLREAIARIKKIKGEKDALSD